MYFDAFERLTPNTSLQTHLQCQQKKHNGRMLDKSWAKKKNM